MKDAGEDKDKPETSSQGARRSTRVRELAKRFKAHGSLVSTDLPRTKSDLVDRRVDAKATHSHHASLMNW